MNVFCVNVIAVKTGPVKFDRKHQSKGGGNKDNRRVNKDTTNNIQVRTTRSTESVGAIQNSPLRYTRNRHPTGD